MTTWRKSQTATAFGALALLFVLAAFLLATCAQASSAGTGCVGAYGWPVRPFNAQHPVRANFGDPRTRFADPAGVDALVRGEGSFSFHQGVDISAPDGTAVYSGRALNGIGRWRPWMDGYCAYYPWIGGGPALRPPFSGSVESDGYRCYAVRAEGGYYVLFQPDGTFVGTLVPLSG